MNPTSTGDAASDERAAPEVPLAIVMELRALGEELELPGPLVEALLADVA